MKSKPTTYPTLAAALGLLLLASTSSAQTAPALPAASETIQLTPFEVNDNSVSGYGASETMTGSRVAMQIIVAQQMVA